MRRKRGRRRLPLMPDDEVNERAGFERPGEVVSPVVVAAAFGEERELLRRLDALGNPIQSQAVRERDDRRGDCLVVRIGVILWMIDWSIFSVSVRLQRSAPSSMTLCSSITEGSPRHACSTSGWSAPANSAPRTSATVRPTTCSRRTFRNSCRSRRSPAAAAARKIEDNQAAVAILDGDLDCPWKSRLTLRSALRQSCDNQ